MQRSSVIINYTYTLTQTVHVVKETTHLLQIASETVSPEIER
jgi:hypothetical protein